MSRSRTAPSDLADRFLVRFPPGMREHIARAARLHGRSMNQEIIHRLEATMASGLEEARREGAVRKVNEIILHAEALIHYLNEE